MNMPKVNEPNKIFRFDRENGWSEIDDIINWGDEWDFNKVYRANGFYRSEFFGNRYGYHFETFGRHTKNNWEFLIRIDVMDEAFLIVSLPSLPDYMEFLRLYLPSVEYSDRLSEREANRPE